MKKKLIIPFIVCGASSLAALATGPKTNVILFLVDDMGWQDTSVPFWRDTTKWNRLYNTPNMERLAQLGVKVTNAYASPVSSPTRVSIMTGMNSAAHRVTNWTLHKNQMVDRKSDLINIPNWNFNGLQPTDSIPNTIHATTLPQILQQNNYKTIIVGKAHFGAIGTPGQNPLNLGFDTNIAGHAAGGVRSYLGTENFGNKTNSPHAVPHLEKYHGKDIFLTEALTLEALEQMQIAQDEEKPFFLYMSHYAIHTPLDKDNRFYQKYRDQGADDNTARYAALIEGMDKSLGDIMDYLENNDMMDNTAIIFMGDNGGLSAVSRVGKYHNYPLRSGKGSSYEGGIRVPMIAYIPNVTKGATTCLASVEAPDIMPTILEVAGVKKYKTIQKMTGRNILPKLNQLTAWKHHRMHIIHYPNKWDVDGDGIGTFSAIVKGGWKLIYHYDTQTTELYNIKVDISEIIDQAKNPLQKEVRENLAKELTSQLLRMDAQIPTLKNGDNCTYPDGRKHKKFNLK